MIDPGGPADKIPAFHGYLRHVRNPQGSQGHDGRLAVGDRRVPVRQAGQGRGLHPHQVQEPAHRQRGRAQHPLGREDGVGGRRDQDRCSTCTRTPTPTSSWTPAPTTRCRSPATTIGDDALLMPEQIMVDVLFFDGRAVGVTLPNFIEQKIVETDPGLPRRHRHRHHQAGQDQHRRHRQRAAVHQRRRHREDRHPHGAIPRAGGSRLSGRAPVRAPLADRPPAGAGGARPRPAGRARLVRRAGLPRGRDAAARALARAGGAPRGRRRPREGAC